MGIVIRQSIKSSIVNYFGAFIGFLTTFFILTKFLTEEEIGLTRVLLESALLLATLAQLGTTASIIKYFPYFKNEKNQHNGFFGLALILPFIGSVIFCSLYILLRKPIVAFFNQNSALFLNYFYYVIPLAVFFVYIGVFETYSSVLKRIVVPRFIREVGIRVMLIVVYILYAFDFLTLDQFVFYFVAVYGIATILNLLYVFTLKQYSFKLNLKIVDKPLRRKFYYYTAFLCIAALGSAITSKIDTFMVSSKLGLADTGIFSVAYYMAIIIEIPFRSLNAISLPIASEHLKTGDYSAINKLYNKLSVNQLIAGGLLFVLIWINVDNIFEILPNGNIYAAGKYVILFIALSRLVDSSFGFSTSILSISKYYYHTLYLIIFLSILTIGTNILLIPVLGITGAALATFITFVIYNTILLLLINKKMKINPFSMSHLKLALIVSGLLFVNYLLYEFKNPIVDGFIRSIIIMGLGVFLILKLKISEDVNRLYQTYIKSLFCNIKNHPSNDKSNIS